MKITVQKTYPKKDWLYPVCDKARIFLELVSSASHTERKALTQYELKLIQQLGFEVDVQGPE